VVLAGEEGFEPSIVAVDNVLVTQYWASATQGRIIGLYAAAA
jgi:hypothetical protein